MILKLKTQTNQIRKQSRLTKYANKQIEDETIDLQKAMKLKKKKCKDIIRQRNEIKKEINEISHECDELIECKDVLTAEIKEEQEYQEQMKNLIAQLKRNIYEVRLDREKMVKEINHDRKIRTNLARQKEVVNEDNEKMQVDFQLALERTHTIDPQSDIKSTNNNNVTNQSISKVSISKPSGRKSKNQASIGKVKALRF